MLMNEIRKKLRELIELQVDNKPYVDKLYDLERKLFEAFTKIFEPVILSSPEEFEETIEIPGVCGVSISGGRGKLSRVSVHPALQIKSLAREIIDDLSLTGTVANIIALTKLLNEPELLIKAIEQKKTETRINMRKLKAFLQKAAKENAKWVVAESI